MGYPDSIKNLIESLKMLPGIGEKSAERLAISMISIDKENLQFFADSILDVKNKITRCILCNNLSENEKCPICKDEHRISDTICIVESVKELILLERIGNYKGLYHVLNGLISPLDGVRPENINIDILIDRINKNKIKEIIMVIKPSIEGETTALYLKKILQGKNIKLSKIAHGVPMGIDMEYIDTLTLETAFEDRKEV